jgi:2,3-dimethylmalate lyase
MSENRPSRSANLQRLIHRHDRVLAVMHPPTAAHARIMEKAGCEALFVGTGGVVGAYTGLSDVGTATMTECVTIAGWIADSVSIPVIMDGDTGHGGIMAVRRMVRECIRAGIAGYAFTTNRSKASARRRAPASRSSHWTRRLRAIAQRST